MRKCGFAGLALSLVTVVCGARPVSADVVINGTFYEESAGFTCSSLACVVQFTPPSSRVIFTKLNCSFRALPSTATLYSIDFGVRDVSNGSMRRVEPLPFNPPVSVTGGTKIYSMSATLDFLSAPGKYPTVYAYSDGNASAGGSDCKLTGRIQP